MLCGAGALVRRGRRLLGNFALFSIIEKLWVPEALLVLHSPAGLRLPKPWARRGEKALLRARDILEETNREKKKKLLKRQNGLKGKYLDVLEHQGSCPGQPTSAPGRQDLVHLGSRDGLVPRSGSDAVFLSI